ncbi:MAG: YIP1 family protein [Bacteroidales bacterium]
MFKNILEILVLLVVQPTKAWKIIADLTESHEEFLSHFIYPLIGIATLCAFVGELLGNGESNIQNSLKEATVVFTSLFAGYYMATFFIKQTSNRWFKLEGDIKFFQRFVGYAMGITFVISAVLELMPDLFFIRVANLTVFYIMWSSVEEFIQVDEKKRVLFAATSTVLILTSPLIIEKILYTLMPGMHAH